MFDFFDKPHTTEFRVTLRGVGVRKRCRKLAEFYENFGSALPSIEVPTEVFDAAATYLAKNFKEVRHARLELTEEQVYESSRVSGFDSKWASYDVATHDLLKSRNL